MDPCGQAAGGVATENNIGGAVQAAIGQQVVKNSAQVAKTAKIQARIVVGRDCSIVAGPARAITVLLVGQGGNGQHAGQVQNFAPFRKKKTPQSLLAHQQKHRIPVMGLRIDRGVVYHEIAAPARVLATRFLLQVNRRSRCAYVREYQARCCH